MVILFSNTGYDIYKEETNKTLLKQESLPTFTVKTAFCGSYPSQTAL